MNRRQLARELAWRKRIKDWVVYDPFTASGSHRETMLASFDDRPAAEQWLAEMQAKDDDGYCGCLVIPRKDYIANHCIFIGEEYA